MKMKIKFFSLFAATALFLAACGNKPAESTVAAAVTTTTPASTTPTPAAKATISLAVTKAYTGQTDEPLAQIAVLVNGKSTIFTENAMGEFQEVTKADFERYSIPAEAVAATSGFWAGLGTAFYAVQKDGKVLVYEGFQDEGQPKYTYKEIKAIPIQ
jgi:glucose/arabinose dehydrogenase